MKLYKVFRADGRTLHDRDPWPAREWMPAVRGALAPCENGYHLCRVRDLPVWLPPPGGRVYEAEALGEVVEADDKVVVRQARLGRLVGTMTHPALVLWAADCAARSRQGEAGRDALAAARAWARHPCERHRVSANAANAAAANAANAAAEREWQGRRLLWHLRREAAMTLSISCPDCDGTGYDGHDCQEDTCCCLNPEENIPCQECEGLGYYKEER